MSIIIQVNPRLMIKMLAQAMIILTIPLFARSARTSWSQEVVYPNDLTFVLSANYPSYALLDTEDGRTNLSLRTYSNARLTYACDFEIELANSERAYQHKLLSLSEIGIEILTYRYYRPTNETLEMFVVDMRDCRIDRQLFDHQLNPKRFNVQFLDRYRDRFDVYYTSVEACGYRACRLSYNVTARRWLKPQVFDVLPREEPRFETILHLANGSSYLVVVTGDREKTLYSVTGEKVRELSVSADTVMSISREHENIGLCYVIEAGRVNCSLMDLEFQKIFSLEMDLPGDIWHLNSYNRKNGGMILLSDHCIGEEYPCFGHVYLTEVQPDGMNHVSRYLGKIDCSPDLHFAFFEDDGDVCARIHCLITNIVDIHVARFVYECLRT